MRNVEIKARVKDLQELIKRAKQLSGTAGEQIPQVDTFYNALQGRLKMREFKDGSAELIYYDRKNTEGPKLSTFDKITIPSQNISSMYNILKNSLGIMGTVKKTRELFMVGQTRVHIDSVEDLGNFVELEVCLKEDQTEEMGEVIANELKEKLGIEDSDLLANAYMDLLLKQ